MAENLRKGDKVSRKRSGQGRKRSGQSRKTLTAAT
jgi:hypothetical protein